MPRNICIAKLKQDGLIPVTSVTTADAILVSMYISIYIYIYLYMSPRSSGRPTR